LVSSRYKRRRSVMNREAPCKSGKGRQRPNGWTS